VKADEQHLVTAKYRNLQQWRTFAKACVSDKRRRSSTVAEKPLNVPYHLKMFVILDL